jgi:predicted DNA-binding transcriptional regulator AlpA
MTASIHQLPETGFLRINQIVKIPGRSEPPIIPISRTSFLNGVKSGKYPQPVKLGERTTAWTVESIRALIVELGGAS